jgi:hypothetical protein
MRWERWSAWRAGDPRWRVRLVDTSRASVEETAAELEAWIADERSLVARGEHPLAEWSAAAAADVAP